MTLPDRSLSRRDFLKLTGLGLGALGLRSWKRGLYLPDFPVSDRLGRNCTGGKIPIKTRPDAGSATVREIYEDTVLPWLREVNADNLDYNRINQRWVEIPEGYIFASDFQPCRNLSNMPLTALPAGKSGFWAEVTVPYVDLYLDNPPARSPGLRNLIGNGLPVRLYFSQVIWIDQILTSDSGTVLYHINEDGGRPAGVTGGSYGDLFLAEGTAFRPLTKEEVAPINPDVDPATKKVIVNLTDQTLSCFEGEKEVYFCRVSTGQVPGWTPVGEHATFRKSISIHMAGGTVNAGFDTLGIAWTTLFASQIGAAIHAVFWHNDFGSKRSHGCVNCSPEDAKWIFRWSLPQITLDTGDVEWHDWSGSTHVFVEERL